MPTKPKKVKSRVDSRKVSLLLPADVIEEMAHEAERQDRSLSGIAQMAWKLARERIRGYCAPPLTL